MTFQNSEIADNYQAVVEKIASTAEASGRRPEDVKLIVVTKGQPVEKIIKVVQAGARLLGENYVQEALDKMHHPEISQDISWHMIGHIQSRKAKLVSENFSFVHSLDSEKLAKRLSNACQEMGKRLPVLLECNVSGEATKSGWEASNLVDWEDLVSHFERISNLPGLVIKGLMTMPPFFDEPERARPVFQKLIKLRDFIQSNVSGLNLPELSMGMSGDFQVAIEEGATMVRIGTAIMGERIK